MSGTTAACKGDGGGVKCLVFIGGMISFIYGVTTNIFYITTNFTTLFINY